MAFQLMPRKSSEKVQTNLPFDHKRPDLILTKYIVHGRTAKPQPSRLELLIALSSALRNLADVISYEHFTPRVDTHPNMPILGHSDALSEA